MTPLNGSVGRTYLPRYAQPIEDSYTHSTGTATIIQSSHSSVYFQIFRIASPEPSRRLLHSDSVRSFAARQVSMAMSSWVALHGAPRSDNTISSSRMTESSVTSWLDHAISPESVPTHT